MNETLRDREIRRFVELTTLIKQWFEAEEIEVTDFVVGRMAGRIQDIIKQKDTLLMKEVEDMKETAKTTLQFMNRSRYNEACNDFISLIKNHE